VIGFALVFHHEHECEAKAAQDEYECNDDDYFHIEQTTRHREEGNSGDIVMRITPVPKFSSRFRFRWIPFVAMLAVVTIGVSLGNWQLRRADEKRTIESRLSARQAQAPLVLTGELQNIEGIEYRRVTVRGEFDRAWPLYLDNRPNAGNAGFYLLMPFKIAGSDHHVLIARGWLPVDVHNRNKLLPINTPEGQVEIEGVAIRNPGHIMQLGQATALQPGAILQNLTVDEVAAASKFSMQAFVIEQSTDTHDTLLRNWLRPSVGIERHLGYAFQWYALALTAFLFFVVTGFRRGTK
jgi:surfeit locus 1 family protein